MKQQIKIIILSVVLVALIAAAAVLYGSMSKDYTAPAVTTSDITTADTAKVTVTTADFTMTDKSGNTVKLSDFFGKPLVVNFWATWCYPCKSEMPHFESAYKEYGEEIHFLMVNVGDGYDEAYKFADSYGYTFPVYHDTTYSATYAYGVSSIPMTLFINESGELVKSQIGMMNENTLIDAIELIK